MRKLIINHSAETSTDELAVKKFLNEDGLEGEALLSFAENNEALYGYKGKGEAIKFITDKTIESKYAKKTDVTQSDWNESNVENSSYIKNKPKLGTAAFKDVPSEGNASAEQVVLGNDTRLITDTERNKLNSIEEGAQKNIKPDWNAEESNAAGILNKPIIPSKASDINFDGEHISDFNGTNLKESVIEIENTIISNEKTTASSLNELSERINAIPAATVTGIQEGDKVLALTGTNLSATLKLIYKTEGSKHKLQLLGTNDAVVSEFDAGAFVKDGMLESAELVKDPTIGEQAVTGTYLKLTWNTDSGKGQPMYINVTDLVDVYTAGTGLNLKGKEFSVDTATIATVEALNNTKTELKGNAASAADSETIAGAKKYADSLKTTIDGYTVNGKKISTNPNLDSSDITFETHHDIFFTGNTVNSSIVQIEKEILDNKQATAASLNDLNDKITELHDAEYTGEVNVKGTTGDPSGSVTIVNNNASKKFTFNFAGIKGEKGADGKIGVDGKSAYEIAKANGFEGTEQDWLKSLKGDPGTGITVKGSKDECTKIGDCYIDNSGNLQLLESFGEDNTPSFKNCGEIKGPKGDPGAAAGFGTPIASIDSNTGTPSVNVTASGSDTEKIFNFEFKNLKGAQGLKGDKGDPGETGTQGPKGDKGDPGTGITVKANETACTNIGDCYIDNTGHLQLLDSINNGVKKFTDCGEIKGPKGDKGNDGRGISSVTVTESAVDGGNNEYVFNFTDDKDPLTVSVKNGSKGSTGATGATYKPTIDNSGNISWELITNPSAGGITAVNIKGDKGERGFYFTPSVSSDGTLSWTNNSGEENIPNPNPVNIKGPQGNTGPRGNKGETGATGQPGKDGEPGAAAGFGTPTSSISSDTTGTPRVDVSATGENTAKVFDFKFYNIKGDKGDAATITGATTATTTLDSGSNATASVELTGTEFERGFTFNFGIPKGKDGTTLPENTINTINTLVGYSISEGSGNILCGGDSLNAIKKSTASIDGNGNITGLGTVSAKGFYETSDENLKWFTGEIPVDFEQLKTIPKEYFIWRNRETPINIGTSAQKVQKVYPELVMESEGHLSVDYAKLSIVALKAIDLLNDKIEKFDEKIERLDDKIKKLAAIVNSSHLKEGNI